MHWLDPDYLPELNGTIDRFLPNPHGGADGMILTDGTEVHFPPHMWGEIHTSMRPGARVKVRGVRPRSATLVAAVAIETANGARIIDRGPPSDREQEKASELADVSDRKPMQAEGVVQRALHGPKGEVRGVLLEDGRLIRLPPQEAQRFAALIVTGEHLVVRGEGLTMPAGTVIEAREIGASVESLRRIAGKKPKHNEPKREKRVPHGDDAHA